MKVDLQSSAQNSMPVNASEPLSRANAHGLVRQLQEDTFNGASVENHRARFAHRLPERTAEASGDSSTPASSPEEEAHGDAVAGNPGATSSTLDIDGSSFDIIESGSSSLDYPILITDHAAIEETTVKPWYVDAGARYPLGGSGQNFDWTA